MTGFGNNALNVLLKHPLVQPVAVFAPIREEAPFPYYVCGKLHDFARDNGIPVYEGLKLRDAKTAALIESLRPDLIVVCSFNQIIPPNIILMPKYGVINVHMSLLPKYRGATPTVWALMNGETETGVTVICIEDESVDSGRIVTQLKMKIDPGDNDGSLRLRLAQLSEDALCKALDGIFSLDKSLLPMQNECEATCFPKRTSKDGIVDLGRPLRDIQRTVRALTPYPGARLHYNGREYIVDSAFRAASEAVSEGLHEATITVKGADGPISFHVVKEVRNDAKVK